MYTFGEMREQAHVVAAGKVVGPISLEQEITGEEVVIEDLSVTYRQGAYRIKALDDISLKVDAGEFMCLVGHSGCGKSTLLNVVAGFVEPSSGRVLTGGKQLTGTGLDRGIVFQEYALFPWRTAIKNIEFGLEMKGIGAKKRQEIALYYLQLVGLEYCANIDPHQLSGGMQQRVAIARALAYDPSLLLMDEPFGALDAITREKLQALMVQIWQATRKTVLYVTHNLAEAVFLADRVAVLSGHPGKLKAVVPINLPRPRDPLSGPFTEIQRHLNSIL